MSPDRPEEITAENDRVLRQRLRRAAFFLLIVGLLTAELIYVRSNADDPSGAIGYEVIDGKSYPVMPGETKSYDYGLERIGGKSAVLGAQVTVWFGSLWHGRRLADTVAVLSVSGAAICFFLASLLERPRGPEPSAEA